MTAARVTVADPAEEVPTQRKSDEIIADVSADLAGLRDDVARLSNSLAGLLRGQADAAGASVRGAVGDARSQLSQAASSLRDGALDRSADFERRIEANPLTAMLVAAVVGLAFGVMSRRH